MLFYQHVQQLRANYSEALANEIIDTFLSDKSPMEVNISNSLKSNYMQYGPTMFNAAIDQTKMVMQDTYVNRLDSSFVDLNAFAKVTCSRQSKNLW